MEDLTQEASPFPLSGLPNHKEGLPNILETTLGAAFPGHFAPQGKDIQKKSGKHPFGVPGVRPTLCCCLAGSSKTAPTILIFSIAMGADYSFELISIVH